MSRPALLPFQDRSVAKLVGWQRGLLGHDPGLGKTIIMLRTLEELGAKRVLVVTTVSSLWNWGKEIQRWTQYAPIVVEAGQTPPKVAAGSAVVIGYSQLSLNTDILRAMRWVDWDAVVFDEAHYLKSPASNRTKSAYGSTLLTGVPHVFAMSGTLAPNHFGELFPHLNFFRPGALSELNVVDYDSFLARYNVLRDTAYGPQPVRGQNLDELRELLKPVFHRFSQKSVLKDLPPLRFDTFPMALPQQVSTEIADLLNLPGADLEAVQTDTSYSTLRRALGLLKAQGAWLFLAEELDSHEKIIVFAYHRDVLAYLQKQLAAYTPVIVQGGQSGHERQQAIDAFQQDPGTRIFLGQLTAASEAITLTASSYVVFVEYSATPAVNVQAAKRAHRIGTTNPVLARFLSVPGTLDDAISRVAARRAQDLVELFG